MPIPAYFKGDGRQVMRDMIRRYGKKKGRRVFFATANKQGLTPQDKHKAMRSMRRRRQPLRQVARRLRRHPDPDPAARADPAVAAAVPPAATRSSSTSPARSASTSATGSRRRSCRSCAS
jgi:hypothetical protein